MTHGLTGSGLVVLVGYDSSYKTFAGFSASQNLTGDIIFSIYVFCGEATKKNKYRWFKVEGFGDG